MGLPLPLAVLWGRHLCPDAAGQELPAGASGPPERSPAWPPRDLHSISKHILRASLVAKMVKNPPAMEEIWVPSLGQEDSLEKGITTYSSIFAW